jgi:hypothetical protein
MLRFGICTVADYRPEKTGRLARVIARLAPKRISFRLLRTSVPATQVEIEVFEAVMRRTRLSTGIYRTTWRGRFADLDSCLNEWLRRRHPRNTPLHVHDWAASDCLTSAEWASEVFRDFPNATFTASDLTLFFLEVLPPGGNTYILDQDGRPLQYVRAPLVVSLDPMETRFLPFNRVVARNGLRRLEALHLVIPMSWLLGDDSELSIPPVTVRKIPLTHPMARTLAAQTSNFSIRRHSAFDALDAPVDVIRTMNIFNRVYFPPERLADGVGAVAASLRTGGLWIVGRTVGETEPYHQVSILEKTASGFAVLERINGGSEIEGLAFHTGTLCRSSHRPRVKSIHVP